MICRYAAAESCVWALGVLDEGVISQRVLRINISPISTLAPIVMGAEATGMSIQVLLYVARITGELWRICKPVYSYKFTTFLIPKSITAHCDF